MKKLNKIRCALIRLSVVLCGFCMLLVGTAAEDKPAHLVALFVCIAWLFLLIYANEIHRGKK